MHFQEGKQYADLKAYLGAAGLEPFYLGNLDFPVYPRFGDIVLIETDS